jgi:hypothetical protein
MVGCLPLLRCKRRAERIIIGFVRCYRFPRHGCRNYENSDAPFHSDRLWSLYGLSLKMLTQAGPVLRAGLAWNSDVTFPYCSGHHYSPKIKAVYLTLLKTKYSLEPKSFSDLFSITCLNHFIFWSVHDITGFLVLNGVQNRIHNWKFTTVHSYTTINMVFTVMNRFGMWKCSGSTPVL